MVQIARIGFHGLDGTLLCPVALQGGNDSDVWVILQNKAIDQIRKQRWRTVPLEIWVRDNIPEPTEDEMEAIPKEKLREWISELTDMRRAVFNMYCIDGYSHQEIARMLGITETGSTSILAKARKQLKDKIKRYLKEQDQ